MQEIYKPMYEYCPECHQRIQNSGVAAELYHNICEWALTEDEPVCFYFPYFQEAIRYLEINEYIVTTDIGLYDDMIFARPKFVVLDDNETVIFCAGNCTASVIDFETGTE